MSENGETPRVSPALQVRGSCDCAPVKLCWNDGCDLAFACIEFQVQLDELCGLQQRNRDFHDHFSGLQVGLGHAFIESDEYLKRLFFLAAEQAAALP